MTVFLGTLWSSIKQVKSPYMFDGEHRIALHVVQGNRASSLGEGEVSSFFSICGSNLGHILQLHGDGPSKLVFVQRCQDSFLITRDNSGISSRLGRAIGTLLSMSRETKGSFPVPTGILGFLSIFNRSQASSPFVALKSTYLSRSQSIVRPIF